MKKFLSYSDDEITRDIERHRIPNCPRCSVLYGYASAKHNYQRMERVGDNQLQCTICGTNVFEEEKVIMYSRSSTDTYTPSIMPYSYSSYSDSTLRKLIPPDRLRARYTIKRK